MVLHYDRSKNAALVLLVSYHGRETLMASLRLKMTNLLSGLYLQPMDSHRLLFIQ